MQRCTTMLLGAVLLANVTVPAKSAPGTQVWFAPDNDSADFLDLFRQPGKWSQTRSTISVVKFGPQQIDGREARTKNSFAELTGVDAFRKLRSWGLKLAIEAPAIKKWDCSGEAALRYTLRMIDNVAKAGGKVDYISMDEPLVAGVNVCDEPLVTAAARTASYIKGLAAQSPGVQVGDIESYPFNTASQTERWVTALEANGVKLAYYHLDVNVHYTNLHPELDIRKELQTIRAFLRSKGIPFGVIFWSGYNPEVTDELFYKHTIAWIEKVVAAIGAPDEVIFQSWVLRSAPRCINDARDCIPPHLICTPADPNGCGEHSVPHNLPESGASVYSLTRLVIDGLKIISPTPR